MDKVILYFLFLCIPARILLVLLAKYINVKYLPIMGTITLIPAIGFISIYLLDLRKKGIESNGKIWWNDMRPIHGSLYLLFSIYAIKSFDKAWLVLLIDALLGLGLFINKHFIRF